MGELVKVDHLQKKFGKFQALTDVTFTVEAGEVVGFIGPNGAGSRQQFAHCSASSRAMAARRKFLVAMSGKKV